MSSPGFNIVGDGWSVTIRASSDEACAMLDRYLLPWLPRTAQDEAADDTFHVSRSGEGFELHGAEGLLARSESMEGIVPAVQGFVDAVVVRHLTGAAAVHAGAVAYRGAAVLLPGSSRSGKSTLVAELIGRGFAYFSDEYALIDSDGLLHPYPRALMLREGRPEARPVLASETSATQGTNATPVALILALEYAPDARWDVRPVPQSEMLLRLLKSTPHAVADSQNLIPRLLRASASAACYVGMRGEAHDAAGHIRQLLAGLR